MNRIALLAALCLVSLGAAASPRLERPLLLAQTTHPGENCPTVEEPVCATTADGRRIRFRNSCEADRAGAKNITPGDCAAPK